MEALQQVNSQMEESKKNLETEIQKEKKNKAEMEVRLAVVEDELFEVRESREKLNTEFTDLQGDVNGCTHTHTHICPPYTHTHTYAYTHTHTHTCPPYTDTHKTVIVSGLI